MHGASSRARTPRTAGAIIRAARLVTARQVRVARYRRRSLAAYRYGALIRGIREWVARGVIPEEVIADDMRAARAPVAHVDFRVRGMVGPVADLLRQHYVAGPEGLLVAGAEIAADEGGGRSIVNLLALGPYLLAFTPGLTVSIDGTLARPGWLALTPGPREVTWLGPGGTIRLTVATCPERRALRADGA